MGRRYVQLLGAVACLIVTTIAARSPQPEVSHEVVRLRAHFDSVDVELRSRDVSRLTSSQIERRANLVQWLREYRNAGTFPINDRFPGKSVPFFRDSRGVLCAMAYLIDRSGHREIVDKVAHTRNNAYIAELADDPALIQWLDENGLSVAEAARIQPAYIDPAERVDSDFALRTVTLGGLSLASAAVNIVKPKLAGEILGVLIGSAAIVNGLAESDTNRGTKRVANASKITGGIAVAAGVGAFLWPRIKSLDPANGRKSEKTVSITPSIVPTANSYRVGVAATARF